jgi:hypothetical protein
MLGKETETPAFLKPPFNNLEMALLCLNTIPLSEHHKLSVTPLVIAPAVNQM